ncbi:MAG: hypothetical protein KIT22_02590, partial [Verrucomicrobiae bacterium]|nr:hypothetical protein [Verrucomicrobiae bacterium]
MFLNQGWLDQPTVIDATTFVNTGTILYGFTVEQDQAFQWDPDPVVPFETQNTLMYTNRGDIYAYPGIKFAYVDDFGSRAPSSSFYNGPGATINAEFFTRVFNPYVPLYGGHLTIEATNIVNRGTLQGSYAGDIQIHGVNVDLNSSRIGEGSISFSTYFAGETNFFPETDLRDRWWRYSETGVNPNRLVSGSAQNFTVETPNFRIYTQVVDQPDDTGGPYQRLVLDNPLAFIAKMQPSETNQQFEIVFVSNPDPNVAIDVSWEPGFNPDYPAYTAYIRFKTESPDLLSQDGGTLVTQFVIADTYGSNPNEVLQLNLGTDSSQKPFNLEGYRAFAPPIFPEFPIGPVGPNTEFYPGL